MSMKVLIAEELIDTELFAFAMAGSKRINQNLVSPGPSIGIPWMTDMIWAELDALSNVAPFNKENLSNHIQENPVYWNQLFDNKYITFSDLPNRALIEVKEYLEKPDLVMPSTGRKTLAEPKKMLSEIKISDVIEEEEKAIELPVGVHS